MESFIIKVFAFSSGPGPRVLRKSHCCERNEHSGLGSVFFASAFGLSSLPGFHGGTSSHRKTHLICVCMWWKRCPRKATKIIGSKNGPASSILTSVRARRTPLFRDIG